MLVSVEWMKLDHTDCLSSFLRSVRINFQYAVDILCGSLNRACDVKKLFQYIGLKNTQAPIKIDFVFVNGTYHDRELQRTFRPSNATMFACDQPVILPHVSRQKCTCMVSHTPHSTTYAFKEKGHRRTRKC